MKWVLTIICILLALCAGAVLGYRAAINNQVYYDAPAKILLYSSIMEQGKEEEYFLGEIIRQIRILNDPEMTPHRNGFLIFLPPHGAEFKQAYEHQLPLIDSRDAYKEAVALLCKYNEDYVGFCS